MNYVVAVALCLLSACSAAMAGQSAAERKTIFNDGIGSAIGPDSRRRLIDPSEATYVMSTESNCTAQILDVEGVGLTAAHCRVQVGEAVCYGQEARYGTLSDPAQCPHRGRVTELVEWGPYFQTQNRAEYPEVLKVESRDELDHLVFKFEWESDPPPSATTIRVAGRSVVGSLFLRRTPLALVGFPSDEYADDRLTRSECVVREKTQTVERAPVFAWLAERWERDARYHQHPAYQEMRQACVFIEQYPPRNLFFRADCSVYAGNSGGGLVAEKARIAFGMPDNYNGPPKKARSLPCFAKTDATGATYWDIFFRDLLKGAEPWRAAGNPNWNQLDRASALTGDFPKFIPMSSIVEHSPFFRTHPQYVAADPLSELGESSSAQP